MALKVGLVGLGGIGRAHADSYEKDPLGTLAAVCDVNRERADSFSERYKVRAYYSVKDMLAHEDLDIVDITTSGYEQGSWHYEPTGETCALREASLKRHRRMPRDGPVCRKPKGKPRLQSEPLLHPGGGTSQAVHGRRQDR